MQIKLVILTICASFAAIGFAAPPPQQGTGPSDALVPGGDPIPATNDPSAPALDGNYPGAELTEGQSIQSPAGQIQKRRFPFRRPRQAPPAAAAPKAPAPSVS